MLHRDHFAADVACIATKARLIECEIRAGWNKDAIDKLDDLMALSSEIKLLVEKWEVRFGDNVRRYRDVCGTANH